MGVGCFHIYIYTHTNIFICIPLRKKMWTADMKCQQTKTKFRPEKAEPDKDSLGHWQQETSRLAADPRKAQVSKAAGVSENQGQGQDSEQEHWNSISSTWTTDLFIKKKGLLHFGGNTEIQDSMRFKTPQTARRGGSALKTEPVQVLSVNSSTSSHFWHLTSTVPGLRFIPPGIPFRENISAKRKEPQDSDT